MRFNGAIPAGGSVTITISGVVDPALVAGDVLSNQGTIHFDADGNGTNESTALTEDPAVAGSGNPTQLVVREDAAAAVDIPTLSDAVLLLLVLGLGVLGARDARRPAGGLRRRHG